MDHRVLESLKSLEQYVSRSAYKGWDPYDALNSRMLSRLTFGQKNLRILFIQALKRLPINLRRMLFVPQGHNPKGLGLFLAGYVRIAQTGNPGIDGSPVGMLADRLLELSSPGYSGKCWGYNFDWQSRVFFVPKYTPTIVNTSYVANAYLDLYESSGEARYLDIARSSCDFVMKDLNISETDEGICFSYTPIDHLRVHNANILGSALLARVYGFTGEEVLKDFAARSAHYVMKNQNDDGSWYYAETGIQKWVDSFHTGFVLDSLLTYSESTGDAGIREGLEGGLQFYLDHFFLDDGTPKYYHDKTYPVDIHSAAQGIVTLCRFGGIEKFASQCSERLEKLVDWTLKNMQAPSGYFYHRRGRRVVNRISYMRWSNAWMFYALATWLFVHQKRRQTAGV